MSRDIPERSTRRGPESVLCAGVKVAGLRASSWWLWKPRTWAAEEAASVESDACAPVAWQFQTIPRQQDACANTCARGFPLPNCSKNASGQSTPCSFASFLKSGPRRGRRFETPSRKAGGVPASRAFQGPHVLQPTLGLGRLLRPPPSRRSAQVPQRAQRSPPRPRPLALAAEGSAPVRPPGRPRCRAAS